MKLRYKQAIIGFCPDLTDSEAESMSMAVLVVGDVDGDRYAAAAGISLPPGIPMDAITREILSDVPHLLRRHVDQTLASQPEASLDQVLRGLHHSLRNSLVVQRIDPERRLALPTGEESAVYRRLLQASLAALAPAGKLRPRRPSTPPAGRSVNIWPLNPRAAEPRAQ